MSETPWTPGPWAVHNEDLHDPFNDTAWVTGEGLYIGELMPADARLIAAAPDMADELKAARDELSRWGHGDMHYGAQPQEASVAERVQAIDALLARIRGET